MSNVQEPPIRIQLSPVRVAKKICVNKIPDAYHATKEINRYMESIDVLFRRIKGYITRYGMCNASRSRIASNISYGLSDVIYFIDNARCASGRLEVTPKMMNMREVILDLEKLAIDGAIFFNRAEKEMIFVSDNIILEEVEFGQFEIRIPIDLNMHHLRVVAITPNICLGSTNITHPHVLGDNLCLGAGQRALSLAFQEGRIIDIIEMINSILSCYNSSDAHQMIQTWKGTVLCRDCGDDTLEEEIIGCDGCHSIFCDGCISTCGGCEKRHCASCSYSCCGCDTSLCSACVNVCHKCRKYFCPKCVLNNEGKDYCDSCQETISGSEEGEEANTQVQPDGVGQTTFFER